jgi:hypothetical protein
VKGFGKATWPVIGLIVMAILTSFQEAADDHTISAQEWVQVVIQGSMAAHVWATANLPQYTRMKTFVAAVIVVLQVLYTSIIGGVSGPEAINMVITFLSAVGVAATRQPVTTVINGETVPPQDRALSHN